MSDTANNTRPGSRWSRLLRFLHGLEEAMETTETDILERRLSRLEREVAELTEGQTEPQQGPAKLARKTAGR